jgi:hypothetical protein
MSHPARGSMQRGRGAPSLDGDLTAESIIGAAIPLRRSAGRIPNALGPLLRRVRRPVRSTGIDGQASARGRRLEGAMSSRDHSEAPA